jgi:hypothetical protein
MRRCATPFETGENGFAAAQNLFRMKYAKIQECFKSKN